MLDAQSMFFFLYLFFSIYFYFYFYFCVCNKHCIKTQEKHTTLQGGKNKSGGPKPLHKEEGEEREGKVGMQPE